MESVTSSAPESWISGCREYPLVCLVQLVLVGSEEVAGQFAAAALIEEQLERGGHAAWSLC